MGPYKRAKYNRTHPAVGYVMLGIILFPLLPYFWYRAFKEIKDIKKF